MLSQNVQAQLFWDGTDSTADADGGAGTWDTSSANWDSAATAGTNTIWNNTTHASTVATFGGTAGTVTLGTAITTGGLAFNTTGYVIAGSATNTLGGGARSITTATGVSATVSARIAGTSLSIAGSGTLTLSGDNTYSGSTSFSGGGIVIAGSNTAFGAGQLTWNLSTPQTTLRSDGTNRTFGNSISHAGNFTLGGSGTGNLTFSNTLALGSTSKSLTVNAITAEFQGNISRGGGTYTKAGSGTLIFSGNATSWTSGTFAVSEGTALINGTLGGSANTTVASGSTLGGSGRIVGTVSVSGVLASGNNGIESLSTNALTFNNNSTYAFQGNRDAAAAVAGDLTAVTGALSLSGTVNLTLTDLGTLGTWAAGEKLTLIGYSGAWNNGLFTYNSSSLVDDSEINFSGMNWTFNYNDTVAGTNYTGDLTGLTSFVTMTAIPEPHSALLCSFSLLLLLRRGRRLIDSKSNFPTNLD